MSFLEFFELIANLIKGNDEVSVFLFIPAVGILTGFLFFIRIRRLIFRNLIRVYAKSAGVLVMMFVCSCFLAVQIHEGSSPQPGDVAYWFPSRNILDYGLLFPKYNVASIHADDGYSHEFQFSNKYTDRGCGIKFIEGYDGRWYKLNNPLERKKLRSRLRCNEYELIELANEVWYIVGDGPTEYLIARDYHYIGALAKSMSEGWACLIFSPLILLTLLFPMFLIHRRISIKLGTANPPVEPVKQVPLKPEDPVAISEAVPSPTKVAEETVDTQPKSMEEPISIKGNESVDELIQIYHNTAESQRMKAVLLMHMVLGIQGDQGLEKLALVRARLKEIDPDMLKDIPFDVNLDNVEKSITDHSKPKPTARTKNRFFLKAFFSILVLITAGVLGAIIMDTTDGYAKIPFMVIVASLSGRGLVSIWRRKKTPENDQKDLNL